MKDIKWLFRDPEKTTPEQALRIVCRVLKGTDAANIAMALKHRSKYPNHPAGYCGLTRWVRRVLKANAKVDAPSGARSAERR
jgi:hypothetical protein